MQKKLWPANIIFDIGGVLFRSGHGHPRYKEDPSQEPAPGVHTPILEGLDILRDCAKVRCPETNMTLHRLYILSNWKSHSFARIQHEYKDVFNVFSGTVISGTLPYKKPNPAIYHHLLDKYSLNPAESIFIDDFDHNIQIAQQLGITGIHHTCPSQTRRTLEILGVLAQTANR